VSRALAGALGLCGALLAAPAPAGEPAPEAGPRVQLVAPGEPPLRLLRYQVPSGRRGRVNMSVGTTMSMTMDGRTLPGPPPFEVKGWFDYRVTSSSAGGDIRADYEFGPMEVVEKPGLAPEVVQAMKRALGGMAGTRGYSVIDSRGLVREADVHVPAGASPQLAQMIDGMRQSLRQMAAPFPEEAVGAGARWDITYRITQNGVTIDQVAHVELTALDGNQGRTKITVRQSAPAQPMSPPGLAAGVKMSLVSLNTLGGGRNRFDLTAPVAMSAEMDMAMKMATRVEGPDGKPQAMNMVMDVKMTMDGSGPSLAPVRE
jgi:hypothetical protein